MRKIIGFMIVAFAMLACGTVTVETDIPTPRPRADVPEDNGSADVGEESSDAAPREEATNDLGLPPTFTPSPTELPPTPYTPVGSTGRGTSTTGSGSTTSYTLSGEEYVVQRGDTLAEIAATYGVAVDVLAAANDIVNIDVIEVGQVLQIPEP